ncbi:hypothetical protein [Aromatoleum toluclasticum]|nr:hypothetical protein [Aromatoleum toluclasticum]
MMSSWRGSTAETEVRIESPQEEADCVEAGLAFEQTRMEPNIGGCERLGK